VSWLFDPELDFLDAIEETSALPKSRYAAFESKDIAGRSFGQKRASG
jgi:hypothetical protein